MTLPTDPACADLVTFGGTLTVTCQGCHRSADFTPLQAVLKFGEAAREADVIRKLRCNGCGRRGRIDAGWFRASFGFPLEAWMTPEEIASIDAAAKWEEEQRSQFAAAVPTPRKSRSRR